MKTNKIIDLIKFIGFQVNGNHYILYLEDLSYRIYSGYNTFNIREYKKNILIDESFVWELKNISKQLSEKEIEDLLNKKFFTLIRKNKISKLLDEKN